MYSCDCSEIIHARRFQLPLTQKLKMLLFSIIPGDLANCVGKQSRAEGIRHGKNRRNILYIFQTLATVSFFWFFVCWECSAVLYFLFRCFLFPPQKPKSMAIFQNVSLGSRTQVWAAETWTAEQVDSTPGEGMGMGMGLGLGHGCRWCVVVSRCRGVEGGVLASSATSEATAAAAP